MKRQLPDLVVVGAMRSGTSSLYRYLGAHSQVAMATPKEIHFFDKPGEHDLDWYESHFVNLPPDRLRGEATPTYLASEAARRAMAALIPEARLIAVLRDPVERAWSQYWMRKERELDARQFDDVIDEELKAIAQTGPDNQGLFYLGQGMYVHHLRRLCEFFPREQIHLIRFDDLRDHPEMVYLGLCRYLGIDTSVKPPILGTAVNRYVSFRSLRLRRIGKRLPPLLKNAVGRINTRSGSGYPDMPSEIRTTVTRFFEPLNEQLAFEFGVDVDNWQRSTEK